MKWLKILTQGGGWAAMAAGVVTLLLKNFGINVEESAILPLIVAALGMIQGGGFIPVADKNVPVMSDLHNKTIDAIYHIDKTLQGEGVQEAIAKLWAAARAIKKPEARNVSTS